MAAGDLDRASRAMLRVLALDPNQPDAAAALREIDRRRLTRIQADRAAKVGRIEDTVAIAGAARAQATANNNDGGGGGDGFDLEQALQMLRAGDTTGGLRDLKAFVDANPGNRAARQRIGAAVADRARELEDQGSREQALKLYEQANALRGEGTARVGRPRAAADAARFRRTISTRGRARTAPTSRRRSRFSRRACATTRRTCRRR